MYTKKLFLLISAAAMFFSFQAFSADSMQTTYTEDAMETHNMQARPATLNDLLGDMAWQLDHIDTLIQKYALGRIRNHTAKIISDGTTLSTIKIPGNSAKHMKAEEDIMKLEKIAGMLKKYGDAGNGNAAAKELGKAREQFELLVKHYSMKSAPNGMLFKAKSTSMNAMDMKGMNMNNDTMSSASVAGYWTCPMHSEVHQATSGTCPICGMNLIFMKTADSPAK